MTIFKTTTTASRKAHNTITLESPYHDHFDFIADCVLLKHESRAQFFKILAGMIDEYQPATFVESSLIGTLAAYHWRQLRFCGMFAAITASGISGRSDLLALLDGQERHCNRLYNRSRKLLLEVLSDRINNVGGPTPPRAVAAPKKSGTTRSSAIGAGNFRVFPNATQPIAA